VNRDDLEREIALLRGDTRATPMWGPYSDPGFSVWYGDVLHACVWWTNDVPARFQGAVYDGETGDELWTSEVHDSIGTTIDVVDAEFRQRAGVLP
jgi:hypothetical protein